MIVMGSMVLATAAVANVTSDNKENFMVGVYWANQSDAGCRYSE